MGVGVGVYVCVCVGGVWVGGCGCVSGWVDGWMCVDIAS